MYSREVIDEVLSRSDIVDVISGYIGLKKSGSSYTGLCPFHNEKSPSFSVSPSRQIYHCFGCGEGGNAITFVMKYENYSFPEAVKLLADKAGMSLPEQSYSKEEMKQRALRETLLEINKLAATYYVRCLRTEEGKPGLDYLKRRQLEDKTISVFGLGYASKTSTALYLYLKGKGYEDDILKQSGLFDYDKDVHDKFWNRVIFPIMDVNSRVVGLGGRVMGDAKPKYLNSPETLIFDKSRNLYGLNRARISRKDNIILCEGYMDVIAMHQAGFDQAVASLGTSLTEGHAALLKKYTKNVYICYDSDDAGTKAAVRAIPILRRAELMIKVINMQPYKDPDEFIKNLGAEEFQKRIDDAVNAFIFEISVLEKSFDRSDPGMETQFMREIALRLVRFEKKFERDNYMKAVCSQFTIDFAGMNELVASIGMQAGIVSSMQKDSTKKRTDKKRESGVFQAEKILLTWMIDDSDIFEKVSRYIEPTDFIDGLLSDVAKKLYEQHKEGDINPAIIISSYDSEDEQRIVAGMFSADLDESMTMAEKERALNDTVRIIKNNSIEYKINHVTDDADVLQKLFVQKNKLSDIYIKL